jgi:MFS family permease
VDFRPLRHADIRRLWLGLSISRIGSAATFIAVPFHVYERTGSSLIVGLLGLAEAVPLVFSALLGGALADSLDRRSLIIRGEASLLLCSLVLATIALSDRVPVVAIFAVVVVMAVIDGLQRPALEATFSRIIDHDEVGALARLTQLRWSTAFLLGMALGGVLISAFGVGAVYLFDAATVLPALPLFLRVVATPPPPDAEPIGLAAIRRGLRYARSRQELIGTYVIDIVATFFGMPLALLPAFSKQFGDARAYGLLSAAPVVGAAIAAFTSGWTERVHRHGRAISLAAVAWGIGIVGMGLSANLASAFGCFVFAGAADAVSGVFRMTIWNQTIPDDVRGRLAGIEMVSYSIGPTLGGVESGVASRLFGTVGGIVSGGVACSVGSVAVGRGLRGFWFYDARTNTVAIAERARREGVKTKL